MLLVRSKDTFMKIYFHNISLQSVMERFENDRAKRLSESQPGHPINYLLQRELSGTNACSWNKVIDWRLDRSHNLFRKNLSSHFGCVNAIEFSKDGTQLASGGDDRRILLWNVEKVLSGHDNPIIMQAEHLSNIFCLSFDNCNTKIFSAGNDDFVIIHDIATGAPLDYFMHEQPVFGIAVNPLNDNIFTSACDDGRILLFDIREPSSSDPFCLAKVNSAFHSVMFNPVEPRLITSANSKEGVALWDIRTPKKPLIKYGGPNADQCCMSARFNSDGSQILALRRRLPPVLYATHSTAHLFQFNHKGYYNSCTMKSCCFAGSDDQYILSGSDNFDLFMWKIPSSGSNRWVDKAHMVLKGHRSIVNQVRYNKNHPLIASSGVEKVVKLWSPFPISNKPGVRGLSTLTYEKERQIYSHDEYINLIMQSGQFMSLTFDTAARKNTKEDPRMMAFFDALVQRDINGLSDESDDCTRATSYTNLIFSPFNSASPTETSDDDDTSQLNSTQSTNERSNSLNNSVATDSQNQNLDSDNGFESSQNIEEGEEPTPTQSSGPNIMGAAWILSAVDAREQNQSSVRNELSDSSSDCDEQGNERSSLKFKDKNKNIGKDLEEMESIDTKSGQFADENMLTKLIVQRENHLRRLAKFQVLLECKAKSKRKSASLRIYSSSESSSTRASKKKIDDSKKYFPSKSANSDNLSSCSNDSPSDSSDRNCDKSKMSREKSKYFYRRKYSSPLKNCKVKKRSVSKTLRYSDYKSVGEKSSSCNYWKTKSAICNSSTFDIKKPIASSSTGGVGSVVTSSSTSSSSSLSSSTSESESSGAEKKSKKKSRKRKLERNSTKKMKKESESSSNSSDSSSSTTESDTVKDHKKQSKHSIALKFSPLLRRLKMEQRKRRQKNKSGRKRVVDFNDESSNTTEASNSSQPSKSSDEELFLKRKRQKIVTRKKEMKNSKSKVEAIMQALTSNAVVTTDSGIEIEKSAVAEEQQPCCSKSLTGSNKPNSFAENTATANQCDTNSSDDNANNVAFRKRVPNRKRHYRRTKNSSD